MAATWSGSSDDSYEGDESSDDEELMANLLAFASSHKSKSASEREEMSQEENDSSDVESDSSSNSMNGFMEKKEFAKYHAEFNDLAIKSTRKIKMLREENLELASQNDHLSEQVEKFKKMEDKLKEKGLGYEDDKKISTSNKTIFVKSLKKEETSLVQLPRKKLEIGQSSNAQVKMGPRRQPQAQPPRFLKPTFLLKWLTKERGLSCNLKLGSNLDRFNNEDALNPFIHKDKDKV
ncbi:hypothetical protein LWI29_007213 [Acer saccharum]|uniref:Uncharacterized protein n=1 Tax=Acer saccharum TaxID=4024 RepID=A0AA39SLR4_ACESA|nr:hypothetical protein LWI29_007213 [Acer saccharum]